MLVKEIIATAYILLDNASEEELSLAVALEQYAMLSTKMNYEKILGHRTPEIIKDTIEFSDETGIATEALTDFDPVGLVMLKLNSREIPETSVDLLKTYSNVGKQAVAFWTDVTTDGSPARKVELASPQQGTLDVWYEPIRVRKQKQSDTSEIENAKKYIIASRLAGACIDYVHFKNPQKQANKQNLLYSIKEEAKHWMEIYKELSNKIGTNRPFERVPFRAGRFIEDIW